MKELSNQTNEFKHKKFHWSSWEMGKVYRDLSCKWSIWHLIWSGSHRQGGVIWVSNL